MAVMESSFKKYLEKLEVRADVIEYLRSSSCLSFEDFANWVDVAGEVKDVILQKSPAKDDLGQLARIKQAWKEITAIVDRRNKRKAEGMSVEDPDEPLDSDIQKSVIATFNSAYGWPGLSNEEMGSDSLLGRIRRECEKQQPTMFSIDRTKSMAKAMRSASTRKSKLSELVMMEVRAEDGVQVSDLNQVSHPLYKFFDKCKVFFNTTAVAGCFDITWHGKTMKYVHWAQVHQYQSVLARRSWMLVGRFSDEAIVVCVTAVEEQFRSKAIELTRGEDNVPWGMALVEAQKTNVEVWREVMDLLGIGGVPAPFAVLDQPSGQGTEQPLTPPPPTRPDKWPRPEPKVRPIKAVADTEVPRKQWKTANMIAQNWKICKKFNDKRGCKGKTCPDGNANVCDVVITGNKVCARSDHNRAQHDPQKHGAPMRR